MTLQKLFKILLHAFGSCGLRILLLVPFLCFFEVQQRYFFLRSQMHEYGISITNAYMLTSASCLLSRCISLLDYYLTTSTMHRLCHKQQLLVSLITGVLLIQNSDPGLSENLIKFSTTLLLTIFTVHIIFNMQLITLQNQSGTI